MTRAQILKEKRQKRFAEAEKLKVKDNLAQDIFGGTGQELIKPVKDKKAKKDKTQNPYQSTLNDRDSTLMSSEAA